MNCLTMILSQVEGEPKPDIYWKRGNKILVNDEHYQISSKGKMTIQNTVREDDGDYYCFGRNEIAENKAGIRLTIQGMYLITGNSLIHGGFPVFDFKGTILSSLSTSDLWFLG